MCGRCVCASVCEKYNFKGVVSWCALFRVKCCWERGFCPLSGIEKRPLLGGCLSITTMVISIHNTDSVLSTEVVRFSEGPFNIGGSTVHPTDQQ